MIKGLSVEAKGFRADRRAVFERVHDRKNALWHEKMSLLVVRFIRGYEHLFSTIHAPLFFRGFEKVHRNPRLMAPPNLLTWKRDRKDKIRRSNWTREAKLPNVGSSGSTRPKDLLRKGPKV